MHVITRYGKKSQWARVGSFVATFCLFLGLVSCSPKVTVYFAGTDDKLAKLLGQMADEYRATVKGAVKPTIVRTDPRATRVDGAVLVIGISMGMYPPKAGLSPAVTPSVFLDDQVLKDAGVLQSVAFENWGRVDKQRTGLVLLWDPWGLTGSPEDLPGPDGSGVGMTWWESSARKGVPVVYAGRSSGGLSLRYWVQTGLTDVGQYPAQREGAPTMWTGEAEMSAFRKFVASPRIPGTLRGTDQYGAADLENVRKLPGKRLVLETFSSQMALPVQNIRRFRVLVIKDKRTGDSWLPATVLAATMSGNDPDAAKAASGFAAFLLNKENQRRLADLTGFLPADYRAPGVNAEAAEARKVAINVNALLAIDPIRADYGSEATAWADLLSAITRSPDSWKAIVREKAVGKP